MPIDAPPHPPQAVYYDTKASFLPLKPQAAYSVLTQNQPEVIGAIVSPQEVATQVSDLQTRVAALEERTKSFATSSQVADAQHDIHRHLDEVQRALEARIFDVSSKVGILAGTVDSLSTTVEKLSNTVQGLTPEMESIKAHMSHLASRAWILGGALAAVCAVLGGVWVMLRPVIQNILIH